MCFSAVYSSRLPQEACVTDAVMLSISLQDLLSLEDSKKGMQDGLSSSWTLVSEYWISIFFVSCETLTKSTSNLKSPNNMEMLFKKYCCQYQLVLVPLLNTCWKPFLNKKKYCTPNVFFDSRYDYYVPVNILMVRSCYSQTVNCFRNYLIVSISLKPIVLQAQLCDPRDGEPLSVSMQHIPVGFIFFFLPVKFTL